MMQPVLGRWQVAGTQVHPVMVRWWLNRHLDLITRRLRLNDLWCACWQRQSNRKRRCVRRAIDAVDCW